MAGPAISADAGVHDKAPHIKTFIEWRVADFRECWLVKKAARFGHASLMTKPQRQKRKEGANLAPSPYCRYVVVITA
jgi:hypothetical protein